MEFSKGTFYGLNYKVYRAKIQIFIDFSYSDYKSSIILVEIANLDQRKPKRCLFSYEKSIIFVKNLANKIAIIVN
jgi:hypothetical protein